MDFSCPLGCAVRTETPTELAEHCVQNKILHTREYNCRCLHCKESFKSSRLWAEHWLDKHCMHCAHCNTFLSSFYALALHCEKDHKGANYACSCKYCTAQFKTSSDWGLHFVSQHAYICPVCQKDLQSINALNQHVGEHELLERKPLECYLCKKVLLNLGDWCDHYSSHFGVDRSKQKEKNNLIETTKNDNNQLLKSKIDLEKSDRTLNLLNEENQQLRQIIANLCKNSLSLMQKVNLHDRSIKTYSDHFNSLNINRATTLDFKQISSEHEKISLAIRTTEETMTLCVICFENKRQWACFPCGHFVYCATCKPSNHNTAQCAVCRAKVTRFDNVYLV